MPPTKKVWKSAWLMCWCDLFCFKVTLKLLKTHGFESVFNGRIMAWIYIYYCTIEGCYHLMVFLKNVMHFGHILAADGLDNIAFVVRSVETGPAPSLGLAVQGSTSRQGVLQKQRAKTKKGNNNYIHQDVNTDISAVCLPCFLTALAHDIICSSLQKKKIICSLLAWFLLLCISLKWKILKSKIYILFCLNSCCWNCIISFT